LGKGYGLSFARRIELNKFSLMLLSFCESQKCNFISDISEIAWVVSLTSHLNLGVVDE